MASSPWILLAISLKIDFLFVASAPIHISSFSCTMATSSLRRGVLPCPVACDLSSLLLSLYSDPDIGEMESLQCIPNPRPHTGLFNEFPVVTLFTCHRDPSFYFSIMFRCNAGPEEYLVNSTAKYKDHTIQGKGHVIQG